MLVVAAIEQEGWFDPPEVIELRARYRCTMCHKHCLIPCTLTAAEFRELEREAIEGTPPVVGTDTEEQIAEAGPPD